MYDAIVKLRNLERDIYVEDVKTGIEVLEGHYNISNREAGYLTLIFHKPIMLRTIRVPIDWTAVVQREIDRSANV